MTVSAAVLVCAMLAGDHHLPVSRAPEIAAVEAEAFLLTRPSHVPLVTALAVAYVESRFSPTGSARDRANGVWGVMQVQASRAEAVRLNLLDPAVNIRIGVGMLETAWARAHVRTPRDWVGAYFWGSVPTRRRAMRAYRAYAMRVRRAEGLLRHRIERCESEGR